MAPITTEHPYTQRQTDTLTWHTRTLRAEFEVHLVAKKLIKISASWPSPASTVGGSTAYEVAGPRPVATVGPT